MRDGGVRGEWDGNGVMRVKSIRVNLNFQFKFSFFISVL